MFTARRATRCCLGFSALAIACVASAVHAQSPEPWTEIAAVLRTPEVATLGFHRYNLPRTDLTLHVRDVLVAPALALGTWAGFSGDAGNAMMMGDLVVAPTELPRVLRALDQQHIAVTAVHNHLAGETPVPTYIHFHAQGRALVLAQRLDSVLALTATPRPVAVRPAAAVEIDSGLVFRTLGVNGRAQGNVAQVSLMLVHEEVRMHGAPLNPALAYASPISVQRVDGGRAVAAGDFAVLEPQVAPLLSALAQHGIVATAMHTHLVGETPKVYFVHFWADGTLADVLRGLRAAIDAVRT